MRAWLLFLALLSCAVGVVFVLLEGEEGHGDRTVPQTHEPDAAEAVLHGSARRKASAPSGDEEAGLIDPLPADLPPWGFLLRVVTNASGEDARPVAGAKVQATLVGPEGVLHEWTQTTDAEGTCRLGPLTLPRIPRRLLAKVGLEVHVHDAAGPSFAAAWRPSLTDLAARVRSTPEVDGVRWLARTLSLRPYRRIRGRLLTSSGHPVCGVWVGLEPRTRGFMTSHTGWDGKFEVFASLDATPPQEIEAEVTGAFEILHRESIGAPGGDGVLDVRLPGGDEVAGRVTDGRGKPLAGVHLVLAETWWDPNAGFTFSSGGFTPPRSISRLKTRSAEDGSFAFPGLNEETRYVLWWPGDDGTWQRLRDDVYRGDQDLKVVVTRHRFRLVLVDETTGERVYGDVRLRRLGEDDKPIYVPLRAVDSAPQEDGTIAAPGERIRIHAWARGYAVTTQVFTMPEASGAHDVEVTLRPLAPGPVVRLRLVNQVGEALGPVPLKLSREIEGFWWDLDFELPLEEEADGWLRLRDVPPGLLHLETPEKLGHPPNGRWRFVLPLELDREVPEAGAYDQEIDCIEGGSVRLFLHAPGNDTPPKMGVLRMQHESGHSESPWWYAPLEDGAWDFEVIGDGRFAPDSRAYESSALLPGAWTLEIGESEAWRVTSVPLRVAAGEITDVYVTLQPRD